MIKRTIQSLVIFILYGCTTASIWQNNSYHEYVTQYTVGGEDDSIVLYGYKYQYKYANATDIINSLQWEYYYLLDLYLDERFKVDTHDKISGFYAIICRCQHISDKQENWLEAHGYKKVSYRENKCEPEKSIFAKIGSLMGERQQINNSITEPLTNFKKEHVLTFVESPTLIQTAAKVVMTPFGVMIDGVLAAGYVVGQMYSPLSSRNNSNDSSESSCDEE